jgi:FlgD Ig-like domain
MMFREATIMSARVVATGRIIQASLVALALTPCSSGAIQLHWSNGTTNLTYTEARRCTLLVEAEAGETLPPGWRLQWVSATESETPATLVFQAEAAESDPAAACEIMDAADPAAAASRAVTARFCSATAGTSARLILDAPAGASARLQAIAFVPSESDSMEGTTLRSPEVTLNGGCNAAYAPVVFRASSTHHLGQLDVRLRGTNLDAVNSVPISAPDSSWTYPLSVESKSSEQLTAHAVLAAPLPDVLVGAADGGGGLGAAYVPADEFPPLDPESCASTFSGSQDTTGLQPFDFAFIDAGDSWHIFYTRQNTVGGYTAQTNSRRIGHAVSTDQHLSTWTVVDRSAIQVREGRIWDNLHVWAPTIVRKGITYYMFYTGVQLDTLQSDPLPLLTSEIQRIGIATSTDLISWAQDSSAVYFNKKVPWAPQDSSSGIESWQFRDPFVMPNPGDPANWLMYYVTIDAQHLNRYVVGVAKTKDADIRKWEDVWPLERTSTEFMSADRDESPHAFFRNGNWWLLYASNHPDGDQITYTLSAGSPIDSSGWSQPDSLKAITCGEHSFPTPLNQWHATEYVRVGPNEYLAAWGDDLFGGGTIHFTQIRAPNETCPTDSILLDCPDVWTEVESNRDGRPLKPIALTLFGQCPARGATSLRLVHGAREQVHVAIYDLLGRRVKTLLDESVPAGATVLSWDGRGEQGAVVSSGIYFARATSRAGRSAVRIPLLR